MSDKMEGKHSQKSRNPQAASMKLEDIYESIDLEPCHNANLYGLSPPHYSLEKLPLPTTAERAVTPLAAIDSTRTNKATQKTLNSTLIAVLFVLLVAVSGGLLYIGLGIGHTTEGSYEEKFKEWNASIHISIDKRVHELSVEVEAKLTHLNNLWMTLGKENLTANISLLDIAKFAEDIQENFTAVFNHIEGIHSSLQDHVSSTSTALAVLQQQREELVARLENTTESIDSRLSNLAAEKEREEMTFTNSLANFSIDLRELELDTSSNLNLVNSSLYQDIHAISESLATSNTEAYGLINRSTAEIFAHIENEITQVRGHIDTQVSEVESQVNSQVSEVRGHIDSQVLEVRDYVDSQDSEVRGRISTAVNEVRSYVDSEISGVTENIDARVRGERQYVDTEINRVKTKLSNGALTLQSSGLLAVVLMTVTSLAFH